MQYVFETENLKRYAFPTHINDLVFDRSAATCSEAFIVVLEPDHAPPPHKHDDAEQVYYVLEGRGVLTIEGAGEFAVSAGDVVVVPPGATHSMRADAEGMKDLAIDCFCSERGKAEDTWDEHVRAMCRERGWNYDEVTER